jgi:cation:H+ antiporter
MSIVLLILALAIILASAELFTNGVEWFGRRYELGEGAVGSILAAVGTALPETLVPIIAIVFTGGAAAEQVGIGAILGAPFMLASLAMVVTAGAVVVFYWRGRRALAITINEGIMRRDLSHFLIAYALAMLAGVIHVRALHYGLAVGLMVFYGYYVWETLHAEGDLGEETKPLYFHRDPEMPHTYRIFLQLGVALLGIILGAEIFVKEVQVLSETLGAAPLIVSLLITPIATELPEKFNSVLWMRSRKDTLALGNITGAMVFQSTFPVSVGLIFATWQLTTPALVAGALALFSGCVFYLTLRIRHTLTWWSLGGAGSVYFAYLVYVFVYVS